MSSSAIRIFSIITFANSQCIFAIAANEGYVPLNSLTISSLYNEQPQSHEYHHHDPYEEDDQWYNFLQDKKRRNRLRDFNSASQKFYFRQVVEKFLLSYHRLGKSVPLPRLKAALISLLFTMTVNDNAHVDERQILRTFLEKLNDEDEIFVVHTIPPRRKEVFIDIVDDVVNRNANLIITHTTTITTTTSTTTTATAAPPSEYYPQL